MISAGSPFVHLDVQRGIVAAQLLHRGSRAEPTGKKDTPYNQNPVHPLPEALQFTFNRIGG